LESSQASPVFLSGKSFMSMKRCKEHWRNAARQGKRTSARKPGHSTTLSTTHTWTGVGSNPAMTGRRLTASPIVRLQTKLKVTGI
jgi:hypothetical protein